MNKRTVILRGTPEVNEYGVATEAIRPGYLVKGVTSVAKQTATTGFFANAVALERHELGHGFDNAHQGSGTTSAYYASGDTVKVAVFDSGDEATMYIASGQNILEDDLLQSAGDGTLAEGATRPICRSLETVNEVFVLTAIRVQFI